MEKEELLSLVRNNFPDLSINEIRENNSGWDNNILIINEQIVFRFPKSTELLSKTKNERNLLEILKTKKPLLLIPSYEYLYKENAVIGVKYEFLEGISLNEASVEDLTDGSFNAKGIGDFLTNLHSINPLELGAYELKPIHSIKYWRKLQNEVEINIFPFLNSEQQWSIDEMFKNFFEEYTESKYQKSVIHGDLTASNIIYSQQKNMINAIIDFTDAQLGDPAFDFAGLYWDFGLAFTEEVLQWYNTTESKSLLLERVKSFYGLQPVFHELLYRLQNKQKIDWDTALTKFSLLQGNYLCVSDFLRNKNDP